MAAIKNIPNTIYLQIGEECFDKDFNDLIEVTWCADRINKNDIVYRRPKSRKRQTQATNNASQKLLAALHGEVLGSLLAEGYKRTTLFNDISRQLSGVA